MKPDGVTMETTEPTEATALAEPSSLQENVTEDAPFQPKVETEAAPKAKDEPPAAEPKAKSKAGGSKTQSVASAGASGSSSRVGTASHRTVNNVKSSAAAPGGRKTTAAAAAPKASAAGAVPKRPASAAAVSSTARNQTRAPDKRPVGPARTTTLPRTTVTNGTRAKTTNGTSKRPAAEAPIGARPKTTTTATRTATSTAPKPSTAATRPGTASSKTTRPAAVPSASRATATKPSTTATAKPAASRVTTAPSAGRTLTAQSPKTAAAAKKADVSRPPSAAVTKKPTTDSSSLATKKQEPSKPTTKLTSVPKGSTTTKAADAKVFQSKPQHPAKPIPTKRPVAAARPPQTNKPPLDRTPPASPASKPVSGTPVTKRGTKPTQTVPPFTLTKKTEAANAATPAAGTQSAAGSAAAAATEVETPSEASVALQQGLSNSASAVEEVPTHVSDQHTAAKEEPKEEAAPSPSQSPVRTTPQTSFSVEPLENSPPSGTVQEQVSSPAKCSSPPVAGLPQENADSTTNQTPPKPAALPAAAKSAPQMAPPADLNEEEDEEEREGSQLVSVSEMSGTTQPTEESRPGSGGPAGGSAWRAGGALLSELDSEEVSGSQQGASELSAPGVLEGTESTDDLGDGSLKGAMDMEGASAGSPDFEKVPDIPVNDFEEDDEEDEDDSDRVCDMDVGSERTDEQQRPRHDNDVDEEEDDDVEMASEGVTESGLESYGNADEDDFADDERLDNLNRVAQLPPPPPVLPSAPAAQWEHPNPFADPWAEPLQPQLVLNTAQAAASPLADPMQADSETPTQTPAQVWPEQEPALFAPSKQDVLQHSSAVSEPRDIEAQQNIDESRQAPVETPVPETTIPPNSKTSPPEDQGDQNPGAAQTVVHSLQPDLGMHPERGDEDLEEEAEPETLPADEILEGPATAPMSDPSSSSGTEDEASDTEGEAQLSESSKSQIVINTTFDAQPPSQRCLSTVEEGEEAEGEERESGAGEEATPPSATSLASYGFDSVTTASNSNAQSTESCIKSPGIFSLEELPEEAKDLGFTQQPPAQQCDAEQQYIECGKQEAEAAELVGEEVSASEEASDPSSALSNEPRPEEIPNNIQPPYYSAICEKTEDSFAGFTALPHPHCRDPPAYPRIYCDIVKPHAAAVHSPKLSCADLPPRSPGQQARSPQLRRLEQHQRQLLELQQRREQQSRPLEEAEQERKKRAEEEERRKKEEAEEELKRNKEEERRKTEKKKAEKRAQVRREEEEELKQRRDLELQLQQQQQELKQRQQIMQWQQELQQTALLSPSSGLCTIYEAQENSDEEDEDEIIEQNVPKAKRPKAAANQQPSCETARSDEDKHRDSSLSGNLPSDSTRSSNSSSRPPRSPERPPPLDLDWGKKADIVQQLINQTLLLNGDGCSSLLLLPGGAGGTLSPLESSLWPSLLPPLTPPSATVTSVSSFSPEATGSSPQGEWTVVELETHH
ncbi:nascent polypeptide-associated complex subunit alpha, muscle-specific form [Kryptolebias marmoratus]|uniref:Nascent polypeptide-associated complex subunit alpha, muscle-specific form-like n=1 Tax=Kryptolebias marmoratus TaxID=37003 RepID=A0A3Q2ZDR1_KRYMA|nr:nascent polypeptide-associated complex subunit alpha, muscle-specific form [Kryptolebias marmoratus]